MQNIINVLTIIAGISFSFMLYFAISFNYQKKTLKKYLLIKKDNENYIQRIELVKTSYYEKIKELQQELKQQNENSLKELQAQQLLFKQATETTIKYQQEQPIKPKRKPAPKPKVKKSNI